jgi:hypothetical protein
MIDHAATEVKQLLKARKSRLSLQDIFHFEHMEPIPKI